MIAKIEQLLKEVEALHASNAEELEALRIKYLSKKGAINDLMADFRNVAADQKKEVGMRLNELKTKAQDKINALKELFESQDNDCDGLDLTRSAYPVELGTRHPLTIVKNEIIDIFARLGFSIAEGPEIEDDWHVLGTELCRRPSGTRYAGHFLYRSSPGRSIAYAYFFRTDPCDGNFTTSYPHHLPGTCVS